jgi:hypothetical protein
MPAADGPGDAMKSDFIPPGLRRRRHGRRRRAVAGPAARPDVESLYRGGHRGKGRLAAAARERGVVAGGAALFVVVWGGSLVGRAVWRQLGEG